MDRVNALRFDCFAKGSTHEALFNLVKFFKKESKDIYVRKIHLYIAYKRSKNMDPSDIDWANLLLDEIYNVRRALLNSITLGQTEATRVLFKEWEKVSKRVDAFEGIVPIGSL